VSESFDVAIVGGGSAGCVVAARLSEDPSCRVLLLEAGPDLRASMPSEVQSGWRPTRSFDWGFRSEPDRHGQVRDLPRGRLLGGCSSTNAAFALRGSPADYDAWAERGNAGWSFDELLPYFRRLERDEDFAHEAWHGADGPLPIRRYRDDELTDIAAAALGAYEQAGLPIIADLNAPGVVGAGRVPVNCVQGTRMSTALAYLPTNRDLRPNLELRCDTTVATIVLEGTRAVGVRLLDGELIRADRVVLCAGAYASPVLLQRSGIGDATELARHGVRVVVDRSGVGHNLADHPSVALEFRYTRDPAPAPLFQVCATLHSSHATVHDPPDLQCIAFGPYPASETEPSLFMVATALLKPVSRGSVTLRSPSPSDPPCIDLRYLEDPFDVDRLLQGLTLAEEIAADPALQALADGTSVEPPSSKPERRKWVRRNSWTYHHAVGTCAMGPPNDENSVVDAAGHVHGAEALLVIDASIMPDVPSANTHVPVVMIAERLADSLQAELRR
jgi:choline dehydrogenase